MAEKGTNKVMLSNIVQNDALKKVQLQVLEKINSVISNTAGPFGSYSMILHSDQLTEYSKDGHKVLKNIKFFKPLEAAVHDELLGITEHVIKTVGDGTTTAVQLSYLIFKAMVEHTEKWITELGMSTYQIISAFQDITEHVCECIKSYGRDLELSDIYDICMISTNGNEIVAEDIAAIYDGKNAFIQIGTSNTTESITKSYDGIILTKGMASPAFVNTQENTCVIYNPRVYYFPDPVDTPELIQMMMTIFTNNIYTAYANNKPDMYIPTVIICPSISRDAESALNDIDNIFYQFNTSNAIEQKPPFCIITGVNSAVDNIGDIVTLLGCPSIKKYINPDIMKEDIEKGVAPSRDTVCEFYGSADLITIATDNATIINPKCMFDKEAGIQEDGQYPYSNTYKSLIGFLEKQIEVLSEDKNDIATLGSIKRRYHNLTSNFVEYNVGGVSAADRDSIRDLVEDAVLNCRSAVINGVGYGACIEGLEAANEVSNTYDDIIEAKGIEDPEVLLKQEIAGIIAKAYNTIVTNLYSSAMSITDAEQTVDDSFRLHKAYNLRTKSFDIQKVLCSIDTDICILQAISRIITIMYSANQAFLVDPMQNAYLDI